MPRPLHLLRRARIVLNINNGFVAGGHERVFTAMCAGAAVFSEASRYYADVFRDDGSAKGREIATFSIHKCLIGRRANCWPCCRTPPAQAAMGSGPAISGRRPSIRWTARAAKMAKIIEAVR